MSERHCRYAREDVLVFLFVLWVGLPAVAGCSKEPPAAQFEREKQLADGYYLKGTQEYLGGHFKEALADFAEVKNHAPGDPRLPAAIAEVLFSQGKLDEALAEFERAAKLDPNRATTWSRIGEVALVLSERRLDPDGGSTIAQERELRARARLALDKAIALNPKEFNALEHRAIMEAADDPISAAHDYERAGDASPAKDRGELYRRAAGALERAGRENEALILLTRVSANQSLADVDFALAERLLWRGKLIEAEDVYRRAAAHDPKDPLPWELVGQLEEKKGDRDAAEIAYRESLNISDRAVVHLELAKLHLKDRKREQALADLQAALEAASKTPNGAPTLNESLELADVLETLGREGDALKLLQLYASLPEQAGNEPLQLRTAKLAQRTHDAATVKAACERVKKVSKAKCP